MSEGFLATAKKKIVGTKQTLKAIEKDQAKRVFIAADAEPHVTNPIVLLCQTKGVDVVKVDTMVALGKACGIEVGCAAAALVED